jgi:ammonia channel protein AmtB
MGGTAGFIGAYMIGPRIGVYKNNPKKLNFILESNL